LSGGAKGILSGKGKILHKTAINLHFNLCLIYFIDILKFKMTEQIIINMESLSVEEIEKLKGLIQLNYRTLKEIRKELKRLKKPKNNLDEIYNLGYKTALKKTEYFINAELNKLTKDTKGELGNLIKDAVL